jgi:hypothetical protein
MVLAVMATLFLLGSMGVLGVKLIASERIAGGVLRSLRTEAEQLDASQGDALKNATLGRIHSSGPSESDRQVIAQWQDIASQIQHPYFKAQFAILFESENTNVPAPWTEHPESVTRFAESHRPFLDLVYLRYSPLDEQSSLSILELLDAGAGSLGRLNKLIFLDAASCLHTADRERFERALGTFLQWNQASRGDVDLISMEPLVCLLHRALDTNLLSPQEVEVWVDRLCKQRPSASWDQEQQDRWMRLQAFSNLDRRSSGWWTPPSIFLAIEAQQESTRRERQGRDRWNPAGIYRTPANKLSLLGIRVALLNHVQQQQSLPNSLVELETTPVVQNVGKAIAGHLDQTVTLLIEYAKTSEIEAILRTADMESLWKGPYPVHETYTVQLGSP